MANNFGVSFNGRRIVHPGAFTHDDASAMVVSTPGSLNLPIIIGQASSGKAGEVKWFNSADAGKEYYGGGDLVTALNVMFSPLPEGGGGASLVGTISVNPNTQAKSSSGGLDTTSLPYGEIGNKIQIKLKDGGIPGTKEFTAFRWDIDKVETYTNIGAVMQITYTGSQSYAGLTVTVDSSSKLATKLEIKVGASKETATPDVSIDLTNTRFTTVEDVMKYISSLSNYSVGYVNYDSVGVPANLLDAVADKSIKTSTYVMATAGDFEYRVNRFSTLVNVKVTGNLTNFDYTYLTGGVKGTAPASWATHLDTIKKQFSDILVVLSPSIAIQAEAMAHIMQMELRNQKQLLFTGGDVGETVQAVKQRSAMLSSSRAVVAYPGIYHKSQGDGKTVLPSYITSAMLAGRVAGVDPSEPITFDYFNVVGLENDMLAGDPVVDELINSGISTLERVQNGGIRLAQGVTTYTGADNTLYREISVRRGADKVSEAVRKALEETFVGKKGVEPTPSAVQTKVKDTLEECKKNEDIVGYQNMVIRQVGPIIYVDYELAPVEPINFVLCTSHFVPNISSAQ